MSLEDLTSCVYDSYLQSPKPWAGWAQNLKLASEEILGPDSAVKHIEEKKIGESLWRISVHRLLLGLSFENLIKGLLIAHGTPGGVNGKLNPTLRKHIGESLLHELRKTGCTKCTFNRGEKKTLAGFEPYVVWSGRYPVSTKPGDFSIETSYTTGEHARTLALWDRLFDHLKEVPQLEKDSGTVE